MNKLYVLQYDDDPYCAPFCGAIFASKDSALKYIKDNEASGLRYVSIYEYNDDVDGYQESRHLYYLNKSEYPENYRHFWDGFDDKTFISSAVFYSMSDKM